MRVFIQRIEIFQDNKGHSEKAVPFVFCHLGTLGGGVLGGGVLGGGVLGGGELNGDVFSGGGAGPPFGASIRGS